MSDVERISAFEAQPEAIDLETATMVGRAMIVAQQAADATLVEARAEAERVRFEARAEAAHIDQLVAGLRDQVASLSTQLAALEATAAATRTAAARRRSSGPIERQAAALVLEEFQATMAVQPVPGLDRSEPPCATSVPPVAAPAPESVRPDPVSPEAPPAAADLASSLRLSIRQIPLEAILPIVAIVVVLGIMLVWLG